MELRTLTKTYGRRARRKCQRAHQSDAHRGAGAGRASAFRRRAHCDKTYGVLIASQHIFITGGTGYLGRSLIPVLVRRGHHVRALVRAGSEHRLPAGCDVVRGNVLDRRTFMAHVETDHTVVHLVGTPHPSPAKARQFREIDLVSARETIAAATEAAVRHFVYVSVAQPAPVMRAYQAARAEAEALLLESGLRATILRPWYVLGPGHQWASVLKPVYWMLEQMPSTRDAARRLGLVTLQQMTGALVAAIEHLPAHPSGRVRMVTVPDIRRASIGEGQQSSVG